MFCNPKWLLASFFNVWYTTVFSVIIYFHFSGDKVYYIDGERIDYMNLDGGNRQTLHMNQVAGLSHLGVAGEYVYCTAAYKQYAVRFHWNFHFNPWKIDLFLNVHSKITPKIPQTPSTWIFLIRVWIVSELLCFNRNVILHISDRWR